MWLVNFYANQYAWRRWATVYPDLGDLSDAAVLDLGCGIGDHARDLSGLGAEVTGIDASKDVIEHAASRGIPRARFVCDDIRNLVKHGLSAEGVWTGFVAAYFPSFEGLLGCIDASLKPGGWLAITELDDLFGHEPLDPRWTALVERYYARSLDEGLYRFRSHDHVQRVLSDHGWDIQVDRDLDDDEFCFSGPAAPDVLEAWRIRLDLMIPRFVDRYGADAAGFGEAFLQCLQSAEHRSRSRVWFLLARRPGSPRSQG